MTRSAVVAGFVVGLSLCAGVGAGAGVCDPQIMTDHSVYRGELACSTLDRNIADAYRVFQERYGHSPASETEKLVALWMWKSEHFMHACDNKVYYGPANPDANAGEDPPWLGRDGWMDNKDCQMNQFSFSFGLCYSVHAHMSALIGRALGDMKRVRCPEITGHTPFEAYVDGRWVLADFTMGLMLFDDDGRPVGLGDVLAREDARDKAWFESPKRGGPYRLNLSPFGDLPDSYSKVRWQQYLFGYNAMPIVYTLRPGESFTRYLDPGLEDGKTWMFWGRDYWGINGKPKHGPFRNVTFLDDYPIGNERKGRGRAYYGNGVFDYSPPLADGRYEKGAWESADVGYSDGALRGRGEGGYVVFEHVSPYVIAARPVQADEREWDVMREKCCDGAVVSGAATGKVAVTVSVDGGRTWQRAGEAMGEFRIDFTDVVKGRHQYLIRFGLTPADGLKSVNMRTITQVGRGVFPRLKDGGTKVTYEESGRHAIHGGPSQELAERFRRKDMEDEGYRVYQIKAPGAIRSAAGAARVSGPGTGPWSVEFSLDGGRSWRAGMKDVSLDASKETWGSGKDGYPWAEMEFADNRAANDVLIRFGRGNILHCQVFATYEVESTSGLNVTYGWMEDSAARQESHAIRAGQSSDTWTIPTGAKVQTKWVRFVVE